MKLLTKCFHLPTFLKGREIEMMELFDKRNEKLLFKFWEFLRMEYAHETLSFYMSIQEFKIFAQEIIRRSGNEPS
ncbi:Oidioi.mRNA.OKI2018_I69.chr2.g5211.t1.cds [Oikopleura dioica]|uniref:Oidioi.mRNA.OKI2018_I69.chr2.g5211.t1.cds n=1 Tax=Oikopleura dioica TaxID=34765 RepID=A0ABN7T066_OIKDI|nr:Oidioi.mRNA.OKI2018_I69.chr2.g5211.t1.cds [Oikopleura dioica]